ncbi:hypothetical protein TruAng_002669 [Truncatella angustata]|nr:hypothetical protein TruAng_002669 [Truncatella angustata]
MPVVDSASIPPIEIGTFDAFHPQNSEFTGSSSGVFFVNTVFRAFAKFSQGTTGSAPTANSFKPASVDGFIGTAESNQEPVVENASSQLDGASTTHRGGECPTLGLQTYGISVRGLGNPPDPTLAKQLVMLYFEHWHPFFPFLHGPTFFDDLSTFYDNTLPDVQDASCERRRRMRLCRAVTYQCIFNIAAAAHPRGLPPTARIQSPLALLEVLGILSVDRDLASLQALMAAELYLVTIMSLRAASTIHGTLTRLIYHSGLHRCPFRYIQLPRDVREMRKRILWCAYTHDRYLSQSLGHPLGLQDSDIDVCMPGTELHKPVDTSHCRMSPQASPVNDINSHLPSDHPSASAGDAENVGSSTELPQQPRVNSSANGTLTNNQVLRNYQGSGGSAVNVQEQFAKCTYWETT